MPENRNISSLFDRSGNLTIRAMEQYLRGELSPEDRAIVDAHLAESPFDREALEGFSKHREAVLEQDISDLETMINTAGRAKRPATATLGRTRYYIAAAASLAAIVTVTAILVFMFRQTTQQPELAVLAPDTVLKQVGGVKAPAKPDSVRTHREALPEATVVAEAMPMKINQDTSAPASKKENQEVEMAVQHVTETAVPQMIIAEDEVTADQEVSYDETGQVSPLESISEAVGGVQMSSQKANYIFSDRLNMAMAQDTEVSYEETVAEGNEVFITVEQMPSFPGGDTALIIFFANNLHYPEMATQNKIQGRVFVQFVVEKDGSISNAAVLRGIGGGCDEEALSVIKLMPRWNPGKQRGQAVRVQCVLPVKFTLSGE
jgi:TonB family protein